MKLKTGKARVKLRSILKGDQISDNILENALENIKIDENVYHENALK